VTHPDMDLGGGMVLRCGRDEAIYSKCSWKGLGLNKTEIMFLRSFHRMRVNDSWDHLDCLLAMCGWDTWIGSDPDYIRLESVSCTVVDGLLYRTEWEKIRFDSMRPQRRIFDGGSQES